MLLALHLRDFVIVDSLEIDFGAGFTVLTGETGAGKSILLDALALVTGARADPGVVREGCTRTDISATFRTSESIESWLEERELSGDPGVALLRRVIDADGRSRALINGHPATAALLRELGEQLLDIHGQHAAQSLLRSDGQRLLLDGFAGLETQGRQVASAWTAWRTLARELEQAETHSRELALERERLQWQATELGHLKLAQGEWEELESEHKRLSHAASLIEAASGAAELLADSDGAIASSLHQILQRLRPLVQIDERLKDAFEMLDSATIQVEEAASELADYASRLDLDPERLTQLEHRISTIFSTARKMRLDPGQIPQELERIERELSRLDASRDLEAGRARLRLLEQSYRDAANGLSQARRTAALELQSGVSELIANLGMAGGCLQIAIEPADPGASGIDRVEFRVAAHVGASPKPLSKIASGGELSRVGLAIAVVAAQANPVPTLIFDEADAGIGGSVADVVGSLMRRLGDSCQVLCVTHLPQVAARAHQQLAVSKHQQGGRTVSRVVALQRADRIEEIARMLGGIEITATTRKHARELLAQV
ncbi:MAG: DNA repair protein RecN [Quisquiliibacterium sp.]